MKDIQYRVIERATNKLYGYLVGKTPNQELVVQVGVRTVLVPINATTNAKYLVLKVEASNE